MSERHPAFNRLTIEGTEYSVVDISNAARAGVPFGLNIRRDVPVYVLDTVGGMRKGAYVPSRDIVLFFTNTDDETKHHELTHVVEYHEAKRPSLVALYERVKQRVTDESFSDGTVSNNFRKDIHEFIADGRTKRVFIEALRREGLYEDFVNETAYLFA